MSKSYTIVEKSQKAGALGGGWWYVLQGKFSDMAPLTFVGQSGVVTTNAGEQAVTVEDAQVRNGVLSLRLDGVDGHAVPRQATLKMGA